MRNRFHRCVLNAYSQRLGAGRKPGEEVNVIAGDGAGLPPLRAVTDSGAGASLRQAADREEEQRKHGACYHLQAAEHADCQSRYPTLDLDSCASTWGSCRCSHQRN